MVTPEAAKFFTEQGCGTSDVQTSLMRETAMGANRASKGPGSEIVVMAVLFARLLMVPPARRQDPAFIDKLARLRAIQIDLRNGDDRITQLIENLFFAGKDQAPVAGTSFRDLADQIPGRQIERPAWPRALAVAQAWPQIPSRLQPERKDGIRNF